MSRNFINRDFRDLRTAFDLLDRNQDGRVTANELQFMLKNLGINVKDEIINDLVKEASQNGNGLIDETEFLQWVGKIQALRDESEESTSAGDSEDDITQDLVAAFSISMRHGRPDSKLMRRGRSDSKSMLKAKF